MCAHVCFAALTLRATDALAQASIFESGPYIANLSAHSVIVRAETEAAEQLTLTVEPGGKRVTDDAPKANIHSLAIDGLDPKKTYRYTVTTTHGSKEDGTFTTAPADDDKADVRFVLFGDDRGGVATHELIVKRVADEPIDFLVNTGDLVADGRIGSQWESFFDIEDKLLRDHCMFTAIGNHELVQENGASYLKYFGTAEEQQKHVFYTTFRWGFLRFFVLNGEGSFLAEDRAWLERELQKADVEPNLLWRVVLVHSGPFSSGLHGDNEKQHGAELPKLLRDHHVDFILAGHDHDYERGASDGLRYVVSGGAGAPLYPVKHVRSSARKVESTYHYVVFQIGPESGKLVAKRIDGSVIEEVGFTKHNLWNDDGPAIAPASTKPTTAPVMPGGAAPDDEEDHPKDSSGGRGAYVVVGLVLVAGASLWYSRRKRAKS
jgi:predicted phosphodiesterase